MIFFIKQDMRQTKCPYTLSTLALDQKKTLTTTAKKNITFLINFFIDKFDTVSIFMTIKYD